MFPNFVAPMTGRGCSQRFLYEKTSPFSVHLLILSGELIDIRTGRSVTDCPRRNRFAHLLPNAALSHAGHYQTQF